MRIFVASIGPYSHKEAVVGALINHLHNQGKRPQIFHPIEATRPAKYAAFDRLADGIAPKDILGNPERGIATIVEAFHKKEATGPVIVVGTDFTDTANPVEFSLNARIAANLGAEVIMVISGADREVDHLREMVQAAIVDASKHHATVRSVIVTGAFEHDKPAILEALQNLPCVIDGLCPSDIFMSVVTKGQDSASISASEFATALKGWIVNDACEAVIAPIRVVPAVESLHGVVADTQKGDVVVAGADKTDIAIASLLVSRLHPSRTPAAVLMVGNTPIEENAKTAFNAVLPSPAGLPVIAVPEPAATVMARVQKLVEERLGNGNNVCASDIEKAIDLSELVGRLPGTSIITPLIFGQQLLSKATQLHNHIVLPEGQDHRILVAADAILRRGIARITILGDAQAIASQASTIGLDLSQATIIDPKTSDLLPKFANRLHELRRDKGVTPEQAKELAAQVNYFGALMVEAGLVDGMVSGAAHTTADVLRPALQVVRTQPGMSTVSSVFLIALADRVLVFGDCAVNPEPDVQALADIAISSAQTAAQFGVEPRVAMLSYSSGDSGTGASVEAVREATRLVKERAPQILVDGPLQFDAAIDPNVAKSKLPDSPVAGKATVYIFPDLNTGNNTYKAVQRTAGALAVGPVLQGLNAPINDLSRGATVADIINTVAITALQAK